MQVKLLLIVILPLTYQLNYPNCLQNLPQITTSNNFNRNFIELTSFLFSEEDDDNLQQAAFQILTQSNSTTLKQYFTSNKTDYLILGITLICMFLILFFIRAFFSKGKCINQFANKDIMKIITPCLVILSLLILSISGLMAFVWPQIKGDYQSAQCQLIEMSQVVYTGDSSEQWSGVNGYLHRIQNMIEYLKSVQIMPNSFPHYRNILHNKIQQNANFTSQLYSQYHQASIPINSSQQTQTFKNILPQLFTNNNTLVLLNQSIIQLIQLAKHSINSQISLQLTRQSASDSYLSIQTKTKYLQIQSQKLSQISDHLNRQALYQDIQQSSWLPLAIKLFITFALISSISYTILIILSTQTKQIVYDRLANLVWVIYIILIIVGIYILYSCFQLATKQNANCQLFQNMKQNSQIYSNISQYQYHNKNSFMLLYPCLFGDNMFHDLASTQKQYSSILHLLANLTIYQNTMNIEHPMYINGYTYNKQFIKAVTMLKQQQLNMRNSSVYLYQLLEQLNKYAYENITGEDCYRHKWVYNYEGCDGINTIVGSIGNQLLDRGGTSEYCLLFHIEDPVERRLITFGEFMGNYVNDWDDGCNTTLTKIQQIGRQITDTLAVKSQAIEPLRQDIIMQKQQLQNWLKLLRIDYYSKLQQYSYITTFANQHSQINKQTQHQVQFTLSDQNNCSVISGQLDKLFSIVCLNLRAGILKFYIMTIMIVILMGASVIIGVQYGFEREIQYNDNKIDSEEDNQNDNESDDYEVEDLEMTKKYIGDFFRNKKSRKN